MGLSSGHTAYSRPNVGGTIFYSFLENYESAFQQKRQASGFSFVREGFLFIIRESLAGIEKPSCRIVLAWLHTFRSR